VVTTGFTSWGSNAATEPAGDAEGAGDSAPLGPGAVVAVDGDGRGVTIEGLLPDEPQAATRRTIATATAAVTTCPMRDRVLGDPPAATGIRGC